MAKKTSPMLTKPLLSGQDSIGDVFFAIIPLLLYFAIMFAMSWISARLLGLPFASTVTLAFTGASNNFELALASSTAIFGTSSNQAVATVLGPLIEIPVMPSWFTSQASSSMVTPWTKVALLTVLQTAEDCQGRRA